MSFSQVSITGLHYRVPFKAFFKVCFINLFYVSLSTVFFKVPLVGLFHRSPSPVSITGFFDRSILLVSFVGLFIRSFLTYRAYRTNWCTSLNRCFTSLFQVSYIRLFHRSLSPVCVTGSQEMSLLMHHAAPTHTYSYIWLHFQDMSLLMGLFYGSLL